MLLKSKLYKNKNFIIFNILTMILYSILYYQIPKYKEMLEDTLLQNSLSYIDSTTDNIIKNITKSDNIIKDMLLNNEFKNRIKENLSLLKNKNIPYIYIVFKTKNNKYRYLLDISLKDRAEPLEIFNPIKPKLWNKIYKEASKQIIYHKNINSLGFTYLKPIIKKSKVVAILLLDYNKSSLSEINKLISLLEQILIFLFTINFVLFNISLYSIIKSIRTNQKLYIDKLTNLYNSEYLTHISKTMDIRNYNILFIDIDYLYKINNNFGYSKGNEVIKNVVKSITKYKKDKDIIIKYNGANFIFLQYKESIMLDIAEKIRIDIEKDENIPITVSIGKNDNVVSDNIEENLKKIQQALYKAKTSGRNQTSIVFDNNLAFENGLLSIETIKNAFDNNNLICLYQPIIDLKTNKASHYESLVRLLIDGKIVAPYKFLPVIENTFLYTTLTKKVLELNVKMLEKYPDIKVSVNFTADDFLNDSIIDILEKNRGLSDRILLEILETQEITDYNKLNAMMKKLREMSYKFAIDDFGSGYSNLMHILNMDISYIKLDASIIKNIHIDKKSFLITENMINFSKKTDIKTICEYVENAEILEVLKELDADYGQGYFFSKPEKIETFI